MTTKREGPDGTVDEASARTFGCGHFLLLEIAGYVVCVPLGLALKALLTPTIVIALVLTAAVAPLVVSLLLLARDTRRRSGRRHSR